MVSRKVTWGLLAAWAVHDAEEWLTMAGWTASGEKAGARPLPGPAWMRDEMSPAHAHTAISLMGTVVAAASLQGARTGGRSALFQTALAGFGVHGLGHLAMSAYHRGYTPGVATAPTVVLPFAWWAWRQLGKAGVRGSAASSLRAAAVFLPASLAAVHLAARALTKKK